jgi:hypothetical protein
MASRSGSGCPASRTCSAISLAARADYVEVVPTQHPAHRLVTRDVAARHRGGVPSRVLQEDPLGLLYAIAFDHEWSDAA